MPIVVVLPVPFTPTIRITAGEWATSMWVSFWQKCLAATSRSFTSNSLEFLMLPELASASKAPTIETVVSTPTSA